MDIPPIFATYYLPITKNDMINELRKKEAQQIKNENMINKINEEIAEQFGLNFDELLNDFYDDSSVNYRRGSSFYKTSIIEINEKHYPDVDKELYGFWETNEYIWNDDYGFDREDIDTLTRVVSKEKTITVKYWEEVEN